MNGIDALDVTTPVGDSGQLLAGNAEFLFRYRAGLAPQAAISLLMPLRAEEYRYPVLHPIFQMNMPEGYVLEQLRNRLAKTLRVDPMLLLALAGSSAPIGRVGVNSAALDRLLGRAAPKGEALEEILTWDGSEDLFTALVDRYILRAGISGVQPKVLVPEAAPVGKFTSATSDLIIKSGRDDFPGLAINEYLCMSVAKEAGIAVPPFYLSNNGKLFVMRRFDRTEAGAALGFEDMAVLMGLPAERKYSRSYGAIAKAIGLYCAGPALEAGLTQLFDMVALSCLLGNGDAHLKNFGLLYSDPAAGDARLAPAYDIVNTTAYIPEDVLALDLVGNKSLFASRQTLLDFAVTCKVERPRERIVQLLEALERVFAREAAWVEQVPDVARAIKRCAEPFASTFG